MIRVLVVDDSPLFRQVLSDLLAQDPEIGEVVTAPNGDIALKKLERIKPDVITMDLEMPGIGGLELIKKIMAHQPTPVVVISALAHDAAEMSLRAVELGAVDVIDKKGGTQSARISHLQGRIAEAVRNAASVRFPAQGPSRGAAKSAQQDSPSRPVQAGRVSHRFSVVAIGASTGGPVALSEVLRGLPADFPVGIVVAQHMPVTFTSAYARRLDLTCSVHVQEARDAERVTPGTVLISPGDQHLKVTTGKTGPVVVLDRSRPVNNHRPSVDVLMSSVAAVCGRRALAVIMTGMGKDGAQGVAEIRKTGGYVMAQDEASSVIYGMNREVVKNGHADEVIPLDSIADRLIQVTSSARLTGGAT